MPIYKQTTEITNIDKVWANINKDIVEVYFGDKNVFSVWAEIENTLPLRVYASGDDLVNYKVFGNTVGGESVGERTENLFDKNAEGVLVGYRITSTGNISRNKSTTVSDYMPIIGDEAYTIVGSAQQSAYSNQFYDSNKNPIGLAPTTATITAPSNAAFLRITMVNENVPNAMVVESSVTPTSYIPYGYKLPMVVRSENLFDSNATDTAKGYIETGYLTSDGVVNTAAGSSQFLISEYIDINGYEHIIVCSPGGTGAPSIALCFYDSTNDYIYGVAYNRRKDIPVDVPRGAMYVRFTVQKSAKVLTMLTEGSTAPTSYIPYYRDEENIYIGSDPLGEDEYVDYGEQKVYRKVNGILTPTDPPTAIPAMPTVDGETIIDYNPSETPAVEPEKMYAKYRKQGT